MAKGLQNVKVLVNLEPFTKKIEKNLTMPKKLKRRTLWDFSTSILLQNSKKIERGTLFLKKLKKVAQCRKNLKRGPFGLVRSRILRGKPFWFTSLGQQVQFGVFSKLLAELFWSLQVVLKKH